MVGFGLICYLASLLLTTLVWISTIIIEAISGSHSFQIMDALKFSFILFYFKWVYIFFFYFFEVILIEF